MQHVSILTVNHYPDAINDLKWFKSDFKSKTITLTWTATGDQADVGRGKKIIW